VIFWMAIPTCYCTSRAAVAKIFWLSVINIANYVEPRLILLESLTGFPNGVRTIHRRLRDVRDRTARLRRHCRESGFAGLAGGDGRLLVLVSHDCLDRRQVPPVPRRRWPVAVVKGLEDEERSVALSAGDLADLDRCSRVSSHCM
jgi:hypothetical protein